MSAVGNVAVEALEKRVAQLDGQLAGARNKLTQLQSELAKAIHDRQDVQNKYKDAQARIVHYQQHLQKTEATVESVSRIEEVVNQLERDGVLLTSMFKAQAKQLSGVVDDTNELRAQTKALEESNARFLEDVEDARKTIADRDRALIRVAAARRTLLQEHQQLRARCRELERDKQQVADAKEIKDAENVELERGAAQLALELEGVKKENARLKQIISVHKLGSL